MDAKLLAGEPRIVIRRDALRHNAALIRQTLNLTNPRAKICAIIKANAYGHGAELVVEALGDTVDMLAVASIDEAQSLTAACAVKHPLLIFRPVENCYIGRQRAQVEAAVRAGWTLTLCTAAAADDVARIALALEKRAQVQVMVDTGMTRSGAVGAELDRLVETVTTRPSLRLMAMCTHFAVAEQAGHPFTEEQLDHFLAATAAAMRTPGGKVIRHAANSGAIFFYPASHLDMVRPGISLYGVDPTGRPSPMRPLMPVMSWTAPLIGIKEVRAGTSVGYGQTWIAPRQSRIGLVPIGYADGYLRALGQGAVMMVRGLPSAVVGAVSMDLTTIDLTDLPQAVVGDEVTVLDNNPISAASVYELARIAGTSPYEIFCRLGPRIPRVCVDEGADSAGKISGVWKDPRQAGG